MGKAIKSIAAVLVAGVLAAGVCCTGFASRDENGKWFGNGDIKTWHWNDKADGEESDKKPDGTPDGENYDGEAGGAIVSTPEENGISFLSAKLPRSAYAVNDIEPQIDTAYLLNVTVEPVDATNQSVAYSVAWTSDLNDEDFDEDISEYISVNPISADGTQAQLLCYQPFWEKIVLTVSSVSNPEVSATCMVDYVANLEYMSVSFSGSFLSGGSGSVLKISTGTPSPWGGGIDIANLSWQEDFRAVGYTASGFTGLGTITETFTFSVKWKFSDYWIDLNSQLDKPFITLPAEKGVWYDWGMDIPRNLGRFMGVNSSDYLDTLNSNAAYIRSGSPTAVSARKDLLERCGHLTPIELLFIGTSEHRTYNQIVALGFIEDTLTTPVSDVSFGDGNIVL